MSKSSFLLAVLIVSCVASISFGASLFFRDDLSPAVDDYHWSDATPWYLINDDGSAVGHAPTSTDNVYLYFNRETVVNSNASCNLLYVGYWGDWAKLTLAPGDYTLSTTSYLMGAYTGSNNLITQNGGNFSTLGFRLGYTLSGYSDPKLTYNMNAGTITTSSTGAIVVGNTGNVTERGTEITFNQKGGTVTTNSLYIGKANTTGIYNITGGSVNGIVYGGNLTVGTAGTVKAELNMGDAVSTGIINGAITASLWIGKNNASVNGWGAIAMGGDSAGRLFNDGTIKADGFGVDRTLDVSQFCWIINQNDNVGTNGYYAVNHGKLLLPDVAVAAGSGAYNWGEDASDTDIDLINSARLSFDSSATGYLTGSLFDSNRPDVPSVLGAIGVWSFQCSTLNSNVGMVIRYDDAKAAEFGITEANLKLYHYENNKWVDITSSIDTAKKQISGTAGLLGYFSVGVLIDNCSESYAGDLNKDCTVNFADLAIFSGEWLASDSLTPIISDLNGDNKVNLEDFVLFAEQWLQISEPYIFFPVSDIVWRVDDPLYKELFSANPVGLAQEGAFAWAHLMVFDNCRKIANQFGLRYVYEDSHKMNIENNIKYIANQYVLESSAYNLAYYDNLYGLQNVATIGDLTAVIPDHDYGGRTSLFPDPVINQAVMDKAEYLVQTHPWMLWALYTGDETHEMTDKGGVQTFASATKPDYMSIADAEVKTQYGNGVYGIPLSLTDTNPYRWIAYRRWLNEKLINRMGNIYDMVKTEEPDIKLISYDPIAGHHPYDFSTWYGKCDILTHQLYPIQDSHSVKFGFTTKLIKDISGIEEVWPCFHVENYATSFTPEEVLELVSQAFRNGATGFHIYPADTIGLRSGVNYLAHEYYGAPERWQLLMKLVDEVRKMKKLQFPEPDFAIMYSCDTYASQGYYINSSGIHTSEIEYAYTLLGPNAKSWFKFIDDNQIERQSLNIADFNAIYIPYAKYERESTIQQLQQYVANGGTLISTDPEIFSYNAWGGSMAGYRSAIFGVTLNGTQSVSTINYQGLTMPVYGTAYKINTSGCTVLATFNNGTPAIVSHPYGSGRAIFFAANPFSSSSVISNESWISFFKNFQTYLDLRTDQDIWRFRFPYSLVKPVVKPNGQCLTNNYIFWQGFKPINILNLNTGGTYKYSLAPDTYADISGAGVEIPFSSGKLTNRWSATGSANSLALGQSLYTDWIVRYTTQSAFSITFDLKQSYPIGKVKLFTARQLPKLDLYGSNNGTDWQKLNETEGPVANSLDIIDTALDGNGLSCRYLRMDFSARDNLLDISEIEIWTN